MTAKTLRKKNISQEIGIQNTVKKASSWSQTKKY